MQIELKEDAVDFFATKYDLVRTEKTLSVEISNVRKEVSDVRKEISDLRKEVSNVEIKLLGKISDTKSELKQEISDVEVRLSEKVSDFRSELKQDIYLLKDEMKRQFMWSIGLFVTMFSVIISILIYVISKL